MAFAPEMRDGFMIYGTDALNLSADESEKFAALCNHIDNQGQLYDFVASKGTGGGHQIKSTRQRIGATLREGTRRVRQRQSVDLANGRSSFGLPTGVPGAQRLPSADLRVVGKGEGVDDKPLRLNRVCPADPTTQSERRPRRPSEAATGSSR